VFRLGVVTDSHHRRDMLEKAAQRLADVDVIAHLGDNLRDADVLYEMTGKPVHAVKGNCDIFPEGDSEKLIILNGVKMLLCHGDRYGVKYGLFRLSMRSLEAECHVALYGHTHVPHYEFEQGVLLFNPGALKDGRYGILEIENGVAKPLLFQLNEG